jgi:hypothetical protein
VKSWNRIRIEVKSWNRIRIEVKSWIRIRIKSIKSFDSGSKFKEELHPDPDPHYNEKLAPDPNQSDADPRP